MQMKPIAAGLASLGRGEDKMLVHMTPGEVAGLQAIAMKHGGSLTINPHTGLPEAGFLSSILPTIAGVALAPVMGPWGAALLAGGLGALSSGSLSKGLMAGLGAFGGSGLGSALQGLAPEAAAMAEGSLMQPQLAEQFGATAPDVLKSVQYTPDISTMMHDPFTSGAIPGTNIDPAKYANLTDALGQRTAAMQEAAAKAAEQSPWQKLSSGAEYAFNNPGSVLTRDNGKLGLMAAAPLLSYGATQLAQQPTLRGGIGSLAPTSTSSGTSANYSFNKGEVNPRFGQPGEPYFLDRGFTRLAEGGSIPPMDGAYPQANLARSTYANSTQTPISSEVVGGYGPPLDPFTGEQRMAAGGIAGVHEYAAGGRLLEGPGDGMSDSIPAVIKGPKPQRAALADSEFVLPADVVSHLGNGSTKAGAKRLYAMMDRVRMARTGRKKQSPQINANRYLPA